MVMMSIGSELFSAAGAVIDRADEVVVVSHRRPDGDAIGSTVAVLSTLKARGRRAWGMLLDPVPVRYQSLVSNGPIEVWDRTFDPARLGKAGAVLVLDTACWKQIDCVEAAIRPVVDRVIVVDHHQTSDNFGAVQIIDPSAAATGLIVYEWFRHLGWTMPPVALTGLFAAVATDTGWFRFSNTDARALAAAGEMVAAGVSPNTCYEGIYWSESPARVALTAHVLSEMTLHEEGRLAIIRIDQEGLRRCGARPSDTEDLINEPMRIGCVAVSMLLYEDTDGRVRVSLRSKGQINVAELAATFGGGGHARAAGLHLRGTLAEASKRMLSVVTGALRGTGG